MTKKDVLLFKRKWRVIDEIHESKKRRVSRKIRELSSLYNIGLQLELVSRSKKEIIEIKRIRNRWKRLAEKLS